jgi:hypothetical protein
MKPRREQYYKHHERRRIAMSDAGMSDKQAAIEMDVEMRKIKRAIERLERAGTVPSEELTALKADLAALRAKLAQIKQGEP